MTKLKKLLLILLIVAVPHLSFAADDGGCSDENNEYINPELGLCSVHAYNIGLEANPNADQRAIMQSVVALKTTVITQQMKKQYDYMDAMIRRFKVQLEKAILQTKLQAAGAATSDSGGSSGGGFVSNDRSIYIAGVNNCNSELTDIRVAECLRNNLNTIKNSSNNGNNITIELRKQLAQDYKVLCSMSDMNNESVCKKEDSSSIDPAACKNDKQNGNKKTFQQCLDNLESGIRTAYQNAQRQERQYNSRTTNGN